MKRIIIALIPLLFIATSYSQTGTLRGKIIDAITGEELIGATVMIVGTTKGAAADLDGNFAIDNIAPGVYDFKAQYIAYDPQTITGIEIKDGEVSIFNFSMQPAGVGLEEVIIEAKEINSTETALLTMQRKSATVIDGISAQEISRAGDSDAASALKRVTGISVEGGKYVFVRGLGDRYMMTTLNHAEIPGLDPNRNTVQMDLFPSNILENMIVHKTFSPELPGSFTGGLVDIITRDFPERFTFQFSTSFGFNTLSSFNDKYLTYEGGSTDWLGIDDGKRSIPTLAEGQLPEFSGSTTDDHTELTEVTKSFNKIWAPEHNTSFMNHSHSISVGNQTKLFGKQFGFIAGLTYSRDYQAYDDGQIGEYQLVGSNSENLNMQYRYTDEKGQMSSLWAVMLSGSLKLNANNKIGIMGLYNRGGDKETRFIYGLKPTDDPNLQYQTRTLGFKERAFASGQLKGEHVIPSLNNFKIDWLGSYTRSTQSEPDLRFFTNNYFLQNDGADTLWEISPSIYPVPSRYFRDMQEDNIDLKLNLDLPFSFLGASSKFKFGGAYVYKERSFTDRRIDFKDNNQSFTSLGGSIPLYTSDDNIGQNSPTWTPNFGLYAANAEVDDLTNSYDADQNLVAAYLMFDMPLSAKLRAVFGARMEKTVINVASRNETKEKGMLDNTDILPSLNLTYGLTDLMNLRFAYYRTLARPTFRELAPFASFDFVGAQVLIGNPNLKRTLIDNIDLRWENFIRPGEIIALSAFFKRFDNPIERTFNTEAANPELTWRNVNDANVYGFEIEYRKQLDFIEALKNFKIGVNATFVQSVVKVDEKELETIWATEPEYPDTRPMAGQSPYIINGLISYKNDSIGFEANLAYNVFGKRLVVVNVGGTPNIYEQPYHSLNFTAKKGLGKGWSLKFEATNLLNAMHKETYTRFNENSTWKNEEYIYRGYYKGTTFKLGINYLIN